MRRLLVAALVCLAVPAAARPAEDAAGKTKPDAGGYIRDWLVGGAYPSYVRDGADQGFRDDALAHLGGEARFRPAPGMADEAVFRADKARLIAGIGSTNEWGFTEDRRFPVVWTPLRQAGASPAVTFDGRFKPIDDHMVVFAACYLESPDARRVTLRVGADDDHKVYLNGVMVGGSNTSQAVVPGQFAHTAELRRGLNLLLVKIVDRTRGCGFCLSVHDPDGNPATDLVLRLDDPLRAAMQAHGLPRLPSAYDRGVFADFAPENATPMAGVNRMTALVGAEAAGAYAARWRWRSEGGTPVEFRRDMTLDPARPLRWSEAATLAAGTYEVALELSRAGSKAPDHVLTGRFRVHDPRAERERNASLKKLRDEWREKLRVQETERRDLRAREERLRHEHDGLYAQLEAAYAELRHARRGGPETFSVDEPPTSAPEAARRRILLNGDRWLMAAGFSRDRTRRGYTPPPEADWLPVRLPREHFNAFFRSRRLPVENVDPANPYGAVRPLKGWEERPPDTTVAWPRFWSRLDVDLGPDAGSRHWRFVCEHVNGLLKVYWNGEYQGRWEGNIGLVEIPLGPARPGANRLELFFSDPAGALEMAGPSQFLETFGIRGDLYLEGVAAPVAVADVAVRTGWRDNRLAVTTEVANRADAPARVRVETACVRNGRVRFRLPAAEGTVPPGQMAELSTQGLWSDPEVWGIGGGYGDPVLYDLVSDLYLDDRHVDRSVTPFGFREFWSAGCDFFLNGRHIVLQGDVGTGGYDIPKHNDVLLPLLRADGINVIRNHDGAFWSPEGFRAGDRLGMLAYANMYPVLHERGRDKPDSFIPEAEFLAGPWHAFNLRNYRRWHRMVRNHPSVVVLSTDNEIFTQAWDTPDREAFNVRNDRLGAVYGRFVKGLDPGRVLTRNGDVGTWDFADKWREEPPCETANYHYPDFNLDAYAVNWQTTFGLRPVIYGETLYYSYGAWDNWIGAVPSQVEAKAKRVREVAALYRRLKVPGQLFMGPTHDGFIQLDETGRGNPWGITAAQHEAGDVPGRPGYPWTRVDYPSASGPGARPEVVRIDAKRRGLTAFNWFEPAYPSHVRNAVNDAYRDTLAPMPPLAKPTDAECLVRLGAAGAGRVVMAFDAEGYGPGFGAVADREGVAWLALPRPGAYRLVDGDREKRVDLPSRAGYAGRPGFDGVPVIEWERTK